MLLEAAVVQSLEALKFLLFRGPHAPYNLTPSMCTTLQAWKADLKREHYLKDAHPTNALLWCNPNLAHFYMIPEPHAWTKFNVKMLSQVVEGDSLIPLSLLISKFNVPES